MCVVAGQTNLEGVKAVQWGIEHEMDAVRQYESQTGNKVESCGLILAPNGFLGASPDGFVGDTIVIEVKCPWRLKSKKLCDLCTSDKSFFLGDSGDGQYYLKHTHDYYHQIQGQMYLSGRNECHMIVWSPAEQVILSITKDATWESNLTKLSTFYCNVVIPRLLAEHQMSPEPDAATAVTQLPH